NLTYHYLPNTNKLDHVTDAVTGDPYSEDISTQSVSNYTYDAIGNLILTKETNSNNLTLTTDNLANGIYFYRILVNEIIIKTDKIVIIK
ncbi:MAG: T9SS type A sorting domain-containing protein, partial [Nitrososphaeraceae archaeon]